MAWIKLQWRRPRPMNWLTHAVQEGLLGFVREAGMERERCEPDNPCDERVPQPQCDPVPSMP